MYCFSFISHYEKIFKKLLLIALSFPYQWKEKKLKKENSSTYCAKKKKIPSLSKKEKKYFAVCIISLNLNNPPKIESKLYKMLGYHLYFSIIQAMTL